MHDWAQIVRERLATLALDDDDAAQVFDELTGHLEQDYRSLLSKAPSAPMNGNVNNHGM
jgi:hypothetical protein